MARSRAGIKLFDALIDTLRVISRTLSAGFERFWDRAPSTAARRSTDPVQEFVAYIKRAGPRRRKAGAAMVRSGLECAPCLASRQRPDDSLVVTLGDGRQLVPVLLTRLRYVVQVAEEHPATEAGLMLHH
jgi:hypothetical protein